MRKKTGFWVACGTVVCGYLCGIAAAWFRGGETDLVREWFSASSVPRFGQAFCAGPVFVLAVLLCGFCVFGWLFVLPSVFLKAYGFGYTAGLFLAAMGTPGLLPLGLCVFPSSSAVCLLLIGAAQEALPFSVALGRSVRGDPLPESVLRTYLLHGLVLFQCTAFPMLWDLLPARWILGLLRGN